MFTVNQADRDFVIKSNNFDSAVKKVVGSTADRLTVFIISMICAAVFIMSLSGALLGLPILSVMFVPVIVATVVAPLAAHIYANTAFKKRLLAA